MRKFFLVGCFCLNILQAEVLAYAQNNVPGTHCTTGKVLRDNPILITTDLMYGQVQSNVVAIGDLNRYQTNNFANVQVFIFPNEANVGFRGSIGIGSQKGDSHASVVYTRLTSGDSLSDLITLTGVDEAFFNFPGSSPIIYQNTQLTFYRRQHLRYQTLDLLVQTARYMLGFRTRFQPLVGGRYLNLKRDLLVKVTNLNQTLVGQTISKLHGLGVFLGTDIRFIVNPRFHFFGNGVVGLLGGSERNSGRGRDENNQKNLTFSEDYNLTMNPFWEFRFGFAASNLFPNGMMVSFRMAYEMISMMHALYGETDQRFSIQSGETKALKVQAGTLGLLFAF